MLTINRAKQVALFVAMAGAMVYKFLDEIDQPVGVIIHPRRSVRR